MMNLKDVEINSYCNFSSYYPSIYVEGLRKIVRIADLQANSNQRSIPSTYE
jgi:hypothetical protein